MIRLSKTSKSFGEAEVLRDISVEFAAGRVTAIVGPNGAGKTTLLNIATGIERPSSGSVWLGAQEVTSRGPERHREAGIIRTFQEPRIFTELSVLENIRFADPDRLLSSLCAAFRWKGRWREPFPLNTETLSLLEDFGLGATLHTACSLLSYGQRRLVELAMAFSSSGVVYLLDEPSSGVGRDLRAVVTAQMESLARGGASVVVVDHDIEFVREAADEIVFLERGRVIHRGPTAEVLDDPQVRWRLWGAWGK